MKLVRREVEKPWGRVLPDSGGRRIGEIWFEAPQESPLLVKILLTSERLSVQVHPDDAAARARGLANGKSECWYILDAEPGAVLGLGLTREVDAEALAAAARDGSIVDLLAWQPAAAGDFFYVPAGTVHAIGAGLTLIEVQQSSDTTYRLYDYGRPRELHLDEGIAVARRGPWPPSCRAHAAGADNLTLVAGPHFTLLHVGHNEGQVAALAERERWAIPLAGILSAGGEEAGPGDCLLIPSGETLACSPDARLLLAANGV